MKFELSLANMTKATTYENITKLCCGAFSRKQILQFAPAAIATCDVMCDVSTQLLFPGDSTSLCSQTCDQTRPTYLLQSLNIGKMNTDYFKLANCELQNYDQNYEFLITSIVGGQATKHTNPSSGSPSGLMTMPIVGGQIYNIQPSCVAGRPLGQTISKPSCVAGRPLSHLTTSGHIQAERSCTADCSCVFFDPLLANYVSLKSTDALINSSFISSQNSMILEPTTRGRARNRVRKNSLKSQRDREPSRVCVKRLHKMFHSKCSRKTLRCAIKTNEQT